MKSNQDLLAWLEARFETGREKYREDLKEMREEIKLGKAEMKSTVYVLQPELEETIQCDMRAVKQPIRSELDETTSFNEAAEIKPNSGMMQSIRLQKCSGPKENCGPRKRLAVTSRKTTSRATVAWHSENLIRRGWTRN
jgi:DNA replication protein DnaD